MCTVTVVPHEKGIRLMCNRDERRSRPAALPPQVHDLGGRFAVFPLDPQGGGSWIGVNDAGIVVTLLNVSGLSHSPRKEPKRSRGLIVREVLRCGSLSDVLETVASLDASLFEMFRLVVVHRFTAVDATSDGVRTAIPRQITVDTPLLFTSSSLGDALVEAPRKQLFQRMVVERRSGWLRRQARFHRHQWPSRPEISVRMERDDALTVSRTVVDVIRANHIGDGRSTGEALVWAHPRYRLQASTFLTRHSHSLDRVLAPGERMRLAIAGNHAQGTLFRDGAHLWTPALERRIDEIAQSYPGFFVGRFDVRYSEVDGLRAGRGLAIVELNGATAESTDIYDPKRSLLSAYRQLFKQWSIVFTIGAANRATGAAVTPTRRLASLLRAHLMSKPAFALSD